MRVSASSLASFHECPEQWRLDHSEETKHLRIVTSRMVYGITMHEAMHVLHRFGDVQRAVDTFEYYWHPQNQQQLTSPVQVWVHGDDWSKMRRRGVATIRLYADQLAQDTSTDLALEYPFELVVPPGRHTLVGFIDRLSFEMRRPVKTTVECLRVTDFKTGMRKPWPRHNIQGSVYCWAVSQRPFWDGFGEHAEAMWQRFGGAPRRFEWMDLREVKHVNGGWRGELDDARVVRSVNAMGDAVEAGIFGLNIDGSRCQYCAYSEKVCGGVGLPAEDHGAPALV